MNSDVKNTISQHCILLFLKNKGIKIILIILKKTKNIPLHSLYKICLNSSPPHLLIQCFNNQEPRDLTKVRKQFSWFIKTHDVICIQEDGGNQLTRVTFFFLIFGNHLDLSCEKKIWKYKLNKEKVNPN